MKKFYQLGSLLISAFFIAGCIVIPKPGPDNNYVNTSQVFVPEEGGINFIRVTDESVEQLINPNITRTNQRLSWWANPFFAITKDGERLAYLCQRNSKQNIFVTQLNSKSSSQQRTFTGDVQDVTFSPDGKTLCYSKKSGSYNTIFTTSATQGSVIQQISSQNVRDYGPRYSLDGKLIFFSRYDGVNYAIWSQDITNGTVSYYCYGMSPYPISNEEFLCVRANSSNHYEIWRVNFMKGSESIILSQEGRSFTTPSLSPDGKWILCAGNTKDQGVENVDIYVVDIDGSHLTQLTYHQGNDLSPVWSPDGKSIYFISQRGSEKGNYNIWKMDFPL